MEPCNLTIQTTHGPIRGQDSVSVYGDRYYSFEGIPFAKPPLGELRFKAPQPIEPWTQVLDCMKRPEKTVQINSYTNEIEGSEDCLYLNVYVKTLQSAEKLPVMIYIHGGAFMGGNPTRDNSGPDYFMMKNIVLVTIAYRCGPFGFLSFDNPDLQIPGNAGLKDQVLALKWLSNNVTHFNGDPNNITLFGNSAGAVSVHYLMLTHHTKNLFHKAILLSGTLFCPWALSTLKDIPCRLAKAICYDGTPDPQKVLEYLENVKVPEILCTNLLTQEEIVNDIFFPFGPVIEPFESELCIIPNDPKEMLSTAWSNSIPIMVGGTSLEGLFSYPFAKSAPFLLTELQNNIENFLPLELKKKFDLEKQKKLGAKLYDLHFEGKPITLENVLNYCDYTTYKMFWLAIFQAIKSRFRLSSAPTFVYRFDFDSPDFNLHRIKRCGKEVRGVSHADDLSYMFYGHNSFKLSQESLEYKTIERMMDILTSFAQNSDPKCESTKDLNWPPLKDIAHVECLNISDNLSVIKLPEMCKLQVWEEIYEEH